MLEVIGPGADVLTIDAAGASRVLRVAAGADASLSGLTITGGQVDGPGGGVLNESAALALCDVTIVGNAASNHGGGVCNSGGDLSLLNVRIAGNLVDADAVSWGGGLYNDGTLTITGGTVSGNHITGGRALGGGILNEGLLTLTGASVSDNSSEGSAGGIGNHGTMTLLAATVSGNSAASYCGGVANQFGTAVLINTVVTGNAAAFDGGGVRAVRGTLTLTHVTVAGNAAGGSGGGIDTSDQSTVVINNSIVAMNSAEFDPDVRGAVAGSHTLIGIDPGFVDPAAGDYRLKPASIAINVGDGALAVDAGGAPLTTDGDGLPRVADAAVDVGAFEYQGPPDPGREDPSLRVTTLQDAVDAADGQTSLREALAWAMFDPDPSTVTFLPHLAAGTIALTGGQLWLTGAIAIEGPAGGLTLDADGDVDLDDFALLKWNFGAGAAVPAAAGAVDLLTATAVEPLRPHPLRRGPRRARADAATPSVFDVLAARPLL
ncbi:MAG: hypothetical protein GX591_12445 [Planctomycetes bacterium]|nr:hypothetical protein [Planctomycetota bacterium]